MKKEILYLFIILSSLSMEAQDDVPIYSFFTAGHTYGSPNNPHYGLHDPFVEYFPTINEHQTIEFGVLTGDVVVSSTAAYWDSALSALEFLDVPYFVAAGNHDMGAQFTNYFEEYYFSFYHNSDLFIILTPGLGGWNISGDQLDFLSSTLEDNTSEENNIFIFMHELIWWSPDNIYQNVQINYEPQYPGSTNYLSEIQPLLLSYPNNITLFAGDLGCTNEVTACMFHQFSNITLIGSGMGGGEKDNIIITDVYSDGVAHNLIALNGDSEDDLGEITDYSIIPMIDDSEVIYALSEITPNTFENNSEITNDSYRAYPNPCDDYFIIENHLEEKLRLDILDISGRLIRSELLFSNSKSRISISNLDQGIYHLTLYGDKFIKSQKIFIQ